MKLPDPLIFGLSLAGLAKEFIGSFLSWLRRGAEFLTSSARRDP